jgi:riboflavin synthase
MFTGIIKNTGMVKKVERESLGLHLTVQPQGDRMEFTRGGSIAVNGVCLTITDFNTSTFTTDVVKETISRTNLSRVRVGESVNLELPLKVGERIDGHILEGHVDGEGKVTSLIRRGSQVILSVKVPHELTRYIVENGSIGIDGVSLTVKEISGTILNVSLIPYTFTHTTFSDRKAGDLVNIEVDRMGKYLEKQLKRNI